MRTLRSSNQTVHIAQGELVGYLVDNHEFIHQKGSPGWRNSDTEMFPVIGPTAEAGFRVQVPKGNAILDQHGLLRELTYKEVTATGKMAVFRKGYQAGTPVKNRKFPEKSTAQWLVWPYDFEFIKTFELTDNGLAVRFTISGERDMPFMLGYHPAFKIYTDRPIVESEIGSVSLPEIMQAGSRALEIAPCTSVVLKDKRELRIGSEGFGQYMLWTEVPNMLCIEPITFYPYAVPQARLHEGFQYLGELPAEFRVNLIPAGT